ncbi:MAG: transposase [Clostridia bacterium]|nr:transposase [Clostridia bacterium]
MILTERKRLRLADYDYSSVGAYFITLCTKNKVKNLSRIIVGDGLPVPKNTVYGDVVKEYIDEIKVRYSGVYVDKFVIMPNHIHMIVVISQSGTGNPSPTISTVMGWFKYQTTKTINKLRSSPSESFWQRSYFDHIIRGQQDYDEQWRYIDENPIRWMHKV